MHLKSKLTCTLILIIIALLSLIKIELMRVLYLLSIEFSKISQTKEKLSHMQLEHLRMQLGDKSISIIRIITINIGNQIDNKSSILDLKFIEIFKVLDLLSLCVGQ